MLRMIVTFVQHTQRGWHTSVCDEE